MSEPDARAPDLLSVAFPQVGLCSKRGDFSSIANIAASQIGNSERTSVHPHWSRHLASKSIAAPVASQAFRAGCHL